MKKLLIAGAWVLSTLASNSYAARCPEVSEINQSPMSGGGFSYQAPLSIQGQSFNWTGGDKWTGKDDIKTLAFTSVRIQPETIDRTDPKKSKKWAVICRYEGQGAGNEEANATMVLTPGRQMKSVSDNWKTPPLNAKSQLTAPVGTFDCSAATPSECEFN